MSSLFCSTMNTRALPTGDNRYIRSDYPAELSAEERRWLMENRITTVVDLRDEKEYREKPCVLEGEDGFVYHHLPVTGGGAIPASSEAVAASYLAMVDAQMEKIISTIMEAETNVLYFCTAGKDRTGVVSALILHRLGFGEREIIDDYMESKTNLTAFLTAYAEDHPEVDIRTILPREENIERLLRTL